MAREMLLRSLRRVVYWDDSLSDRSVLPTDDVGCTAEGRRGLAVWEGRGRGVWRQVWSSNDQGNRLKVPGPLHWGIGLPNPSSRACPGDQDKHKLAIPCPYWSPGQALPGSHILGTTFRRLPSARMKTRRRGKCPGNPAHPRLRCPIGLCLGVGNGSSTAFNPEVPETQRPRVHELWVSGTSGTSGLKT